MTVIDAEWNTLKKAVLSGDFKAAEKALLTILDKSMYIEKFEDFKNDDRHTEFISEYRLFVECLGTLKNRLGGKDAVAINSDMKAIQDGCMRCHIMFK